MKEILFFLNTYPFYWGVFLTLVPVGVLTAKRKRLDMSFRFLLFYLIAKFLIDVGMLHYASIGKNNIWLHNMSVPVRYLLLCGFFYHLLESPRLRKGICLSAPLFLTLTFADVYFSNSAGGSLADHLYVRYSGVVECILMLLWILLYFYEVFKSLKIANLLKSPGFLVAVAWMLYYASLVFFVPLFYYVYRAGTNLDVGYLQFIPDGMDILVIVIVTVAVCFIPAGEHD